MSTLDKLMSEAEWQSRVTDYCDLLGLKWHHEVDSRKSKSGWPDLTIAGPKGAIFAELKKQDGLVSPEQSEWLKALAVAGLTVVVWRPLDWPEVQAELDRIAGRTLSRWSQTTRGRS